MPYIVLVTAVADKLFKKLPKSVKNSLVNEALALADNPLKGEQLTGELRAFRALHVKLNNVHYRIAYEVNDLTHVVLVRAVAVRENFYKRLEKMKLKKVA